MAILLDQSSYSTVTGFGISNQVRAIDFAIGSAMTLTSLSAWFSDGSSNNNGLLDSFSGTLSWAIYTSVGGLPGALIATGASSIGAGTLSTVDTGVNISISDLVRVDMSLDSGVALAAGSYFIALHEGAWGSAGDGTNVFWRAVTTGVAGSPAVTSLTPTAPGGWTSTGTDLAMQLFGVTSLAPVVSLFAGESVSWTEGDSGVRLDLDGDATVVDTDSRDFAGGWLEASISAGLVAAEDQIGLVPGGAVSLSGSDLLVDGVVIGTIAWGSESSFRVDFGVDANSARVQELLHFLGYTNIGGDAPTGGTRTIAYSFNDGDGVDGTANWTSSVLVNPVDDPSSAAGDADSVTEAAAVDIAVLANDSDPDNLLQVAMIDGMAVTTGDSVTLSSGATVTLLASGELQYDSGSAFTWLTSAAMGALTGAISSYDDQFTYALGDGASAIVSVTVNGTDQGDGRLSGDAGDNVITGTSGNDTFLFQGGGNDRATGGPGNDIFYYGATLSTEDLADGGGGSDTLALQGDYGGGAGTPYDLGAAVMTGIETLVLLSGSDGRVVAAPGGEADYYLRGNDANVAAGQRLTVQARSLAANETVHFDGAAETDGSFWLIGGAGGDTLIGGARNDSILGGIGADLLTGGAGRDIFDFRSVAESTAAASDFITDLGADDWIDLRVIDANINVAGNQAFSLIGPEAFHNVAGELRVEFDGSNWLVQGDVDGDGVPDLVIGIGGAASTMDFLF